MEATFGQLPPTVVNLTGGGGQHLLFRHPGGDCKVRNLVGFYGGLDVRGDGGYILAPPSVHANGRRYRWSTTDSARRPAEAPEWLLTIVREPDRVLRETPEGRIICPKSARYVAAALRSACQAIASAKPGTRNSTLNTEAFGIGQLVGAGVLEIRDAAMALAEAAFECGLRGQEIERTLQSGLRAGMARPREMEE